MRANVNSEIVLTTWGRSSGFVIDPIEKKPLNHFLPGTPVLSFGTAGCNLACKFCQNWDISKSREMDTLLVDAKPELIADKAQQLGCRSVAFTYNDPVIFHEYAIDVAQACHEKGINTVAVTAGYVSPEPRAEFYQYMDAANVDLKAFTEWFYHKITGSHLQPVLETLKYLKHETQVWFELTTLLIPGENDSDAEIQAMSEWVVDNLGPDVPMHFSVFHPDWKMQNTPMTPEATVIKARQIALDNGIHHVYVGNMHNKHADSTWCQHCGELVIGRDWYQIAEWQLDPHGCCLSCGGICVGVFDSSPGEWGRKRQLVNMTEV
ncbi:Radical SAM, Pyruvate-formate lyase-activating enzyme like [Methylophaga thiooxydans]|uniref:Radical SAM, Pyruvate-formate lyase-activating enzyme like n=1 Tax=Methylophaga thiooxydans TaxID=392484 RepID=A0A0A0BG25_9GAMM|nr:Radical SAM, Pyruvate-formate lyase-activating enzyme like [Methylophaga thiooxydans]